MVWLLFVAQWIVAASTSFEFAGSNVSCDCVTVHCPRCYADAAKLTEQMLLHLQHQFHGNASHDAIVTSGTLSLTGNTSHSAIVTAAKGAISMIQMQLAKSGKQEAKNGVSSREWKNSDLMRRHASHKIRLERQPPELGVDHPADALLEKADEDHIEEYIMNPPETSRSYSTVWANDPIGYSHAASKLDQPRAWSSQYNSAGSWMQIDLGSAMKVSGVVLESRADCCNQWVTGFRLWYNTDCNADTWTQIGDSTFNWEGTNGQNNDKVVDRFASHNVDPVEARCVRFEIRSWNNHISMRAGLLVEADQSERDTREINPQTHAWANRGCVTHNQAWSVEASNWFEKTASLRSVACCRLRTTESATETANMPHLCTRNGNGCIHDPLQMYGELVCTRHSSFDDHDNPTHSGPCLGGQKTFQQAKDICAAMPPGYRLCTRQEMSEARRANGKALCCHEGCGYDFTLTWTET